MPWDSLQNIRSLGFSIALRKDRRDPEQWPITEPNPSILRLFNTEANSSILLLSGASRLPQLQGLRFVLNTSSLTFDKGQLAALFDNIYLCNINRTLEDPKTFPVLQMFETEVMYRMVFDMPVVLVEDEVFGLVLDRLPAVYGGGGCREARGVTAFVKVSPCRVCGV